LGAAALGGVPYAALNAIGIEGQLARGLRPLVSVDGSLTRRVAAGVGTGAIGEGIAEPSQELINQFAGRMAVDPNETLFNDEANKRYIDAAVGGATLGGLLGAGGGIRSPRRPDTESDLTKPLDTTTRPDPSQFVTQDQTVGLKKFIDETTGVVRPSRKDYEKQFEAAFDEPSGQFVADAATGVERELTVGELMQRGSASMDLTQDKPADAAAAATAATKVATTRDPRDVFLRDTLKVTPNPNSRQLFTLMEAEGIDPTSPVMVPVWNYAAAKYLTPKRLEKATELMDKAIIESRKEAPSGTGISTVQQPAGGVGVGSPVVQGTVGDAGRVAPVAGAVDGGAPAAGAPLQQAGLLPVAPGQPSTPVTTGAPSGTQASQTIQTAPQGQTGAAVPAAATAVSQPLAPGQFRRAPRPMTVLEAARAVPTPPVAPVVTEPAAPDIIGQIFGEDDADIIRGFLMGKSSTELAAEAKAKGIKGRGEQMIRNKIAGEMAVREEWPKKIAAAKQKFGYTDEQIQQALEASVAPDVDTRSEVEREMNLGRADLYGVRRSESEAIEAGLEGSVKSAGAGSSAVKGFTKLQKEIDAMYKRLETEKDPLVLAYVTNRLTELQAKVEAFEDKEQARIRATAGVGDADGEADLVAAAQEAEPKSKSISDAEAAKEAEAAKLRAERAAKLQADRNGLAVGDTVKNPKLGTGVVKSFAGDGDATTVTVAFQSGQTKELSVKLAKLEKTNAVQVESPAGVSVQPEAGTGEKVGRQVRRAKKPAAEGKAQVPAKVLTEAEQAAQAWDVVAADFPEAPKFADLTKAQQENFIKFGPDNWERGDVELELIKLAKGGMKFGKEGDIKPAVAKNPYTAKELLAELKDFIRADIPGRKLLIVDSIEDLLRSPDKMVRAVGAGIALEGAYGVAVNGRAYLIANRIQKGAGRAKFMHEVGAHLGLEKLLPKAQYDKLTQQILNWVKKDDGSIESELALNAVERVQAAGTKQEDRRSEMLAYFIEEAMEAGIDPIAGSKSSSALTAWFRTLWAAFKVAARKLGFKPESMNAQDVVNLAFGAARLEINGTWHGTAADFRKFSNAFMGTGEGAQAYGWGTYLAQRTGIAKGYWSADVARKSGGSLDMPSYKVGDKTYTYSDGASEKSQMEYFAAEWLSSGKSADELTRALKLEGNPMGRASLELAREWKLQGKTATKPTGPEGTLMRVDTAITPEETLDWDRPLSEQPAILEKLSMLMPEGLQEASADQQSVEDIGELTGEDLYRGLRFLENNEGAVSEFWGIDDYVGQPGKKVASLFLDSMGIKGIQFLDAKSRGASGDVEVDGKSLWGTVNGDAWAAMVDSKGNIDAAIAELKKQEQGPNNFFADNATEGIQQLEALRGQDIQYKAKVRARNLVIFNDKNIFRVGSEVAADPQRMKFGKNAVSQGLIDRNIAKLPKQSQQPVKNLTAAIGDLGGKYLDYAVFTNDLVKRAQALGLGATKTFSDRLAARNAKVSEEERKIEKIADRYASIEDSAKGSGPGSVNEFLFESTRTGKWGYGKYRDAKMGAAFDKLGPKAQQFVKDVFAHGDATLSSKKKIVLEATNSEYDAMIKAAQDAGDTKTEATLKAEKAATLKRFQTLFRVREGMPYAPIKRTGAYVVIGESAAYKAAKANNDTATVKKLESDPDHYHVSFVDTKGQARNLSDKLAEQGVFDSPQIVKRSESFDEAFSGEAMLPALTKMRAAVDRRSQDATGKKDPTTGKLLNIINQLYLEALAEGSARKSEMRRRGVAGEVDMLQSFTQQGRADANFLASVEFEPKIQDALQQMRNQSRTGDRERKSEVFNELTQRYADSLEPKNNSFINGLTNMASKFWLASSPGYYLQNLTQPFMMSLPAMAGRHDYTKAAAELAKAYGELGPLFKDVKLFDEQFDFSKVPADVRTAINDLVNQGKIDIGLATEINEYKVEADGNLSKFAQRLNKGMRMAVQKVEATNRLSTAIAAYRLEFAKTKDAAKATQYAADILTDTHGDYTAFNAPRVFNTQWGKVALQFRKFQLIQIAFYAKLFRDLGRTPEERAVALKTLGYSLGHTAVFAGMMGLPGYAAISAILSAFGDEDEPYDLTAEMRKALGPEWADMIMRGAPTVVGMDLSGKIGAGNMLSIMPFSDADLSTNAGRAEAFGTLMGGAALGMSSRIIDGFGLILAGDYYKGIERAMPKGVSDALKAGRQAAEGMTRRNGDVILPDSEIGAIDTVLTGLGVPAVKQAVTYERQNRMRDVTENFNDRTTRIKNDYAKAVREKDTAAMAEARAAWTKLQQTRQRNGLKPQPVSNLLKAPQEQKAREQRTVGGVSYRQGQQKLAESIAEN
jgi:hypothetical protein